MVWAVLVLAVPLWLGGLGDMAAVFRTRALRSRPRNIPVRVLRSGHNHWTGGQAVWVSTVFAWRGSPAAWTEDLVPVVGLRLRAVEPAERRKFHRLSAVQLISPTLPARRGTGRPWT